MEDPHCCQTEGDVAVIEVLEYDDIQLPPAEKMQPWEG
jgi:hypothetical protein